MEPYKLDYKERPTTVLEFRLTGDALKPAEITAILGIEPSEIKVKGQHFVHGRLRGLPRTNSWHLKTPASKYQAFEEQLDILLTKLEGLPSILSKLIVQFDGIIRVGYSSGETNFGFFLEPMVIQRLAKLGLSLDFDLYAVGPELSSYSL